MTAATSASRACPASPRLALRRQEPCRSWMSVTGWWLRWMFVLLLAFDQIGSPLHSHHHDSGIDGAEFAAVPVGATPPLLQERSYHGNTAFFHATTAVQINAAPSLAPPGDALDATWFYLVAAFLERWDVQHDIPLLATATWEVPPNSLPVSLPPSGRAPPPHA